MAITKHPKLVAIGGGTGLYTLLRGLRDYPLELTSVVAMTDDGGSTGQLRTEFGVLPPGDIRRSIVALSESPDLMLKLFQYRFSKGTVAGHSFGNLFITALKELSGSDEQAIDQAAQLLRVQGTVLPVTLENRHLVAELADGSIVTGESNIDGVANDLTAAIARIRLDKPADPNPRVLSALEQADLIVIGPGDLYGSILANIVVDGVATAIASSKARVVYVCNLMTKRGSTTGFAVHDFVRVLEQYIGAGRVDFVLCSQVRPTLKAARAYQKEGAAPVKFERAAISQFKAEFVKAPLAAKGDLLHHDSRKLAKAIWTLLQLDTSLKFVSKSSRV